MKTSVALPGFMIRDPQLLAVNAPAVVGRHLGAVMAVWLQANSSGVGLRGEKFLPWMDVWIWKREQEGGGTCSLGHVRVCGFTGSCNSTSL